MAKMPAFSLPGSDGATHSAKSLAGTPYILYFYPRDMTPGCTTESCDFRDHHAEIRKLGVAVFGVSTDSLASHAKFIAKEKLNFVLLADEDHALAEKLAVWKEKNMYGKTSMGIERSTFLVAADGTIAQEWRKVKVDGHVAEVVAAAKALVAKK
ncbi:MAG: thioredoxin-dependent thiol peroxidase [Planctomycetes bacterium]|nr:thioredoxin-dependent thiol peroxidase [Planctomycetota bacterium]